MNPIRFKKIGAISDPNIFDDIKKSESEKLLSKEDKRIELLRKRVSSRGKKKKKNVNEKNSKKFQKEN